MIPCIKLYSRLVFTQKIPICVVLQEVNEVHRSYLNQTLEMEVCWKSAEECDVMASTDEASGQLPEWNLVWFCAAHCHLISTNMHLNNSNVTRSTWSSSHHQNVLARTRYDHRCDEECRIHEESCDFADFRFHFSIIKCCKYTHKIKIIIIQKTHR